MSFNSVHTPFHAMQSEFPPLHFSQTKLVASLGSPPALAVYRKSLRVLGPPAGLGGRKDGRTDVTTQIDLHFTSTKKAKCKHSVSLALVSVLGSHYLLLFTVYS